MIIFHSIRWKNFLSTGNVFTEITLDQNANTLIVGENGAGKSTLLDALTFALFGKPYRNINKPQLINSINTKECLVELLFSIGVKKYHIRRGIKPNVFEVIVDGKLLDQDARAKDYQDMLERMILKMNYKSFTQIVILGRASFTPFMQLTAADRRAVIEDLLDIQIFSNMNQLVKNKLSSIRDEMNELKIRLQNVKEKIDLHKKHIDELKRNNEEMVEYKRSQIRDTKHQMVELEAEANLIQSRIDSLIALVVDEEALHKKNRTFTAYEAKIDNNKRKIEHEIEFYQDNDSCPTCKQDLQVDFKVTRIHECTTKVSELETGLNKLKEEQNAVLERLNSISKVNKEVQVLNTSIVNVHSSISHSRKYVTLLEGEIQKLSEQKALPTDTEEQSQKLFDELSNYIARRNDATEVKVYYDVAATLLKDGGIKTKIIKQYLPIINKLVNKYLASMDFFVNFEIDEEFSETIKSRHRDNFSYASFSEGEKQKIDLSLLLTWRAVARLKNSVSTNLLILDETFDSSLDSKGTDALLQILHSMPDKTNVFIISHKDQMHDKFAQSIKFEKKQDFSRIAA